MITKSNIKYYSGLNKKRNRFQERKFLVEGPKLILEAVNAGYHCDIILTTRKYLESETGFFSNQKIRKIRTESISATDLERITDTKTPQGVIGVFVLPDEKFKKKKKSLIIAVLENVSDPGNVGSILRNCDWFGVNTVVVTGESADLFSPKVIRASAGSVFHLNIIETNNLFEQLESLREEGYKILCADLNGEDIFQFTRPDKSIIVFSNEAHGPSPGILSISDYIITIPGKGEAESLNVASASAVIISQLTRQ